MINLCNTCGCKSAETRGAESFNANESEPIEYSQYRRRINYLEMIYNAFYDYDSSIYQLRDTWTQFINSEGYIEIDNLIRRDILQGSSQLGGQPLFFGNGAYLKMKTNVKNALQRASGTKLSSSMRLHHGGLILAQYEYNGKTFFVQQWMFGSGNSRSTRLMVASEDSIPEDRRELAENRGFFDAETFDAEKTKPTKISVLMLANTHWIPMYKKTKKEGESFDDWYERFMFGKAAEDDDDDDYEREQRRISRAKDRDKYGFQCYRCNLWYETKDEMNMCIQDCKDFDAESYDDESPMMKNITVIGAFALAIIIGKKLKR